MNQKKHQGKIAGVVSFLASDESRFMTGQTLSIDGGMTRL